MNRTIEPRRPERHETNRHSGSAVRFIRLRVLVAFYFGFGALLLPSVVLANAGAAFLKIPVGPRVVGTGEAAVAYVDDASALFYNPAGLANVPIYSVLFAHNRWLVDMNHEYVAAAYGTDELGKFGLAFDYLGSGSIQGVNFRGETIPGYVFSAGEWSLSAGYGRAIADFSFGLGAKFVRQQMESLSTSAWAFDAGAMYRTPLTGLKLGVAATDIGTKARLAIENYGLPWQARIGWRYDRDFAGITLGVTQDFIISEFEKPGIAAGVEFRPVDLLALRVGYRTGSDYAGFSGFRAGLGISWQGLGVDYAFAPYGKLGASHRLAISYNGSAAAEDEGL